MFIARISLPIFTITGFAICLRLLWIAIKSHDHGIYYSGFDTIDWMLMVCAPVCGLGAGLTYSVLVASGRRIDEFVRDTCFELIFGGFALLAIVGSIPFFLLWIAILTTFPGLFVVLTAAFFFGPVMLLR